MKQINDFYTLLGKYLTKQMIISQCIIKDYAVDDNGNATCTAIVPFNETNLDGVEEYTNVNCFVGSAVDIKYNDYMSGILLRQNTPYTTANNVSQKQKVPLFSYFNSCTNALIAIIIPNAETIGNITSATIKADKCYFGDKDTNILDEFSEYLKLLKDFFDQFAQNAPTISQQPADGSAKMVTLCQQMSQKTDEIYQTLTKITKQDEQE